MSNTGFRTAVRESVVISSANADFILDVGSMGGNVTTGATGRWQIENFMVLTPAFLNEDSSVCKNPHLTESLTLQIRSETYNLLNRVVFGGPAANINNPATCGVIG